MMAVLILKAGPVPRNNELFIGFFTTYLKEFVDVDYCLFNQFKNTLLTRVCDCDMIDGHLVSLAKDLGWTKFREHVKSLLAEHNIDTLIIFSSQMGGGISFKNPSIIKTCIKGCNRDDRYGAKFSLAMQQYVYIQFILAASDVCENVYQYIIDPTEPDYSRAIKFKNFRTLYYAACKRRNAVIMPFYEYGLKHYCDYNVNKTIDFTFGATALTDDRRYMIDSKEYLENHDGWDCNIITKANVGVRPQSEYFFGLAQSKFSLVVPSYDAKTFSIERFFECVFCDCVPLVFSSCCMNDISCYPDIIDIINSYLLVDSFSDIDAKIASFSDSMRCQVIYDIMDSESVKMITDLDWLRNRWSQLKGLGGTK